ncbi:MAG: ABC transporter permease [Lachnospiraceae bacterium]|nr:ABC transporter permease [Lachnospiraceae bacterium]
MDRLKKTIYGLLIPVIILAAWYFYTTYSNVPGSLLPQIQDVAGAFNEMVSDGQLQNDLSVSFIRVVKGFLVSGIIGIVLGAVMGMSKKAHAMLLPAITAIRQVPVIAWIPLIILWAGIGEASKVVIIVIAASFPIMINTLSGFTSTPSGYIEVARLYNLNRWQTFIKVYLPHSLPQMLTGLKLGLSVSWMALVASELIAASSGIGYRMNDARSLMRSDKVIVYMVVIGLVGIIMDKVISVIFEAITPWEKIARSKGK